MPKVISKVIVMISNSFKVIVLSNNFNPKLFGEYSVYRNIHSSKEKAEKPPNTIFHIILVKLKNPIKKVMIKLGCLVGVENLPNTARTYNCYVLLF